MEFLSSLLPWHWLIIGFVFLGMEALGTGGFLLGTALTSVLLALLLWLTPDLGWGWQLICFGVGSLVFTVVYWKLFRRINEQSDSPRLNDRAAQLIGRSVELTDTLEQGQGKVQFGDTLWRVTSKERIKAGTRIVVVGTDGMILLVERQYS